MSMIACIRSLPSSAFLLLLVGPAANLSRAASVPHQAVLVGTSRFWFNYRHTANTLGIYHHVKR